MYQVAMYFLVSKQSAYDWGGGWWWYFTRDVDCLSIWGGGGAVHARLSFYIYNTMLMENICLLLIDQVFFQM